MKIACIQFAPIRSDKTRNLSHIRELVKSVTADLIVLPELALTGYFFKTCNEILSLAESISGPLAQELSELARSTGTAIVTGFLEKEDDRYYNSALAFDCKGALAGHYRKVHLFYFETLVFSPGDLGFPAFSLETRSGSASVGMLICYDWRFPEAARSVALGGADLIAMPSNIVTTTGMLHATLQTRAFENKVALAFADRIGTETNDGEELLFRGESAIIGMNGEILAKASPTAEEILVADVDLSRAGNKRINQFNDIFGDRKSGGYGL